MSTPTTKPDLSPSIFKFRVMKGDKIIGQFSNLPLATETADRHRGSVVLDDSGKVIYRDGRLLEEEK